MIEVTINNALKSLCDGRVSPLVAKQGTKPPYLCYTKVSTTYDYTLCGPSHVEYCFQVDVYAKTAMESGKIMKQVQNCLQHLNPEYINEAQEYEPDTELYRTKLEFYI